GIRDETMPDGGKSRVYSWPVWPGGSEPVLVLGNRSAASSVRIGVVGMRELNADPAPIALPITHVIGEREFCLDLSNRRDVERFGLTVDGLPDDCLGTAKNVSSYLASSGMNGVVLSAECDEPARRRGLWGQCEEDCLGPELTRTILKILARRGVRA